MFRREAKSVEEVLISHFGPDGETSNSGNRQGQLQNLVHSIDTTRPDYCTRLLLGQTILALNAYRRYASALYTRKRRCPGLG